jgi:hypothetical protein
MIKDFISEIKKGALARSNRYAISFTPPTNAQKAYIGGVEPATLRKTILFCDQVQLPGLNLSTVQNRTFGEFRETPYEKLFDNITMSFYVDNDMKVKSLFDNWMGSIQDPTTRTFRYYDQYTTDMTIEVQDINDKTRYQVKLFECYPKTIGAIQMDYASKEVMKLSITMQYKYWTSEPKSLLPNNQTVSSGLIDRFTKDFSGFQQSLNNTIGAGAGNFVTGAIGSYGVTKLPGMLRF